MTQEPVEIKWLLFAESATKCQNLQISQILPYIMVKFDAHDILIIFNKSVQVLKQFIGPVWHLE